MSTLFQNINGEVLESSVKGISVNNRSYLYGDGLFETIRVFNGKLINFENHFKRLKDGSEVLKIRMPNSFTEEFFKEKIEELLTKSKIETGGRVRLSLDRMAGGNYVPESNEATFSIDVKPIEDADFVLNSKGIEVDIYSEHKKTRSKLSNIKTKNGLIYVLAGIHAKEKNLDNMLLMNDDMGIIESSSSNLFVVSNGVLYTPGLEDGCLAGTMRMQIINLALTNGVKVYECSILPQNLLSADEVFLTNAIDGVKWIIGYRTKRYFNTTSRKFVAWLNEYWEKQLEPEGAIGIEEE
jgi:branched-subunit amino acid aminotransferase/4-amino-4-deoxychorismate lyase